MENFDWLHAGLRRGRDPDEPAVRRHRRAARHRGGRAAGHRPGDDGRAAAADHLQRQPQRGVHHVRRHLLRRHVRRVDHLDPAEHAGGVLVGDHRDRGQQDGQGRAAPRRRWPRRPSGRSSRAPSAPSCSPRSPRRSRGSPSRSARRRTWRSCCSPSSRSPRCWARRSCAGRSRWCSAWRSASSASTSSPASRGRRSAFRSWPTASTSSSSRWRSSPSARRCGWPRICAGGRPR